MRRYAVILVLLSTSALCAQDLIPRPYAFAGPEAMGGGYAPLAFLGGAGLRIDSGHFLLDANGWYDNGRKTNDNDQPNPNGHDRGLVGSAYYRLPSAWFFGVGYRWSELSTTNYSKSGSRPTFGGGKDYFMDHCAPENCVGDFSMRIAIDYVTRGSDWQNGLQGPLFTVYIPSPSLKKHVFYRETVGVYRFYDTVTDPSDPVLTREQMGHHSWASFVEFTVMYRF